MHLCFCEEEDYELSLSKLFSEYSKEQSEVGYFEGENNIVMVDGDSLYKDGNIVAKKKGKNVWGVVVIKEHYEKPRRTGFGLTLTRI